MGDVRTEQELATFNNQEVVHALPKIQSYWSEKFLRPKFAAIGFDGMWDFYVKSILQLRLYFKNETLRIISIGSGNCDVEIELAKRLMQQGEKKFQIECIDINEQMLRRGQERSRAMSLSPFFVFRCCPITEMNYAPRTVHCWFANQSLHHILALEDLFSIVCDSLAERGILIMGDMIGKNGHTFWPESLFFINMLWNCIDDEKKLDVRKNWVDLIYPNIDHSSVGFEGIRSQDILPLICERLHPISFIGFSSIIRPFISRSYGPNYDPTDPADCLFIDFVARLDDQLIHQGICKPTQCFGVFGLDFSASSRCYSHWTPEFCVRNPDVVNPFLSLQR